MIGKLAIRKYQKYVIKIWHEIQYPIRLLYLLLLERKLNYNKKSNITIFKSDVFGWHNKSRIPATILKRVGSRELRMNSRFNAGQKIVIKTNSPKLYIIALYRRKALLDNMDEQAACGIEVVVKGGVQKIICPEKTSKLFVYDNIILNEIDSQISIYLPSYAEIGMLLVGINKGYYIQPLDNKNEKILFYGSSITHGCASSKPSLNYAHMVVDYFGCNLYNYGFSGSALAEKEIITYIAQQKADLFIIEYDHNASLDRLRNSHLELYKTIRMYSKQPILFLSRTSGGLSISEDECQERVSIIRHTVEYAAQKGDTGVYFLNGDTIFPREGRQLYFVDDRHPNDKGMQGIALRIINLIEREGLLGANKNDKENG